jgi:hypothetical protein
LALVAGFAGGAAGAPVSAQVKRRSPREANRQRRCVGGRRGASAPSL